MALAFDLDLTSIQEARNLVEAANQAQLVWGKATQDRVDQVCSAMAEAAFGASERLGRMAHEETGYGVPEHKRIKNEFASRFLWNSIKDIKTVGVVGHDPIKKIYEIAWPAGIVAALTPSTNPTSTVMAKILMAVKARNGIVVAPHPSSVRCCVETARLMAYTAEQNGAPKGLISCMENISLAGTQELMNQKRIRLILATGGSPMVKAAHSVGKPAYGVGPGNVPVYVDRSAELEKAARYIVSSKAFDFSTICATEQAVIADRPIAERLAELMKAEGAYFVDSLQADLLAKLLFREDGSINPATVGKSPQFLAAMAGFEVPQSARILVAKLKRVGKEEPLSREKLTTVLGWYEADGWEAGCERSIELIQFGGRGHSQIIWANNQDVIMQFGLEKPVFRILVNTPGTLGAIGYTSGVMPSMTLGAGAIGGSITGDNITVYHLFNIKRLAYELMPPPDIFFQPVNSYQGISPQEIEKIVYEVVQQIVGK